MATAAKGTWFRTSRLGPASEVYTGAVLAGPRFAFVGTDSGTSPIIVTLEVSSFADLAPTFTARTPAGSDPLRDCAFANAEAVAIGDNGIVETSSDSAQSWGAQTLAGNPFHEKIVAVSGEATSRFVAVGNQNIWGRTSGGVWTQRSAEARQWNGVAYKSGSGWVAVGQSGFCSTSADGVTWATSFLVAGVASGTFRDLAANNNYFMGVGDNGEIWRSPTGASGSWVQMVSPTAVTLQSIAPLATTGSWVVFQPDGVSFVSTDEGMAWTQNTGIIDDQSLTVRDFGFVAYAVGNNGGVYVSLNETQEDYVDPSTQPDVPAAFNANADMAGDSVRRLVTQFRSGRG